MDVRPLQRARVMVYFDVDGVPLNDVTVASMVTENSVVLQRSGSLREATLTPGTRATLLFTSDGRLYHWPMRLEEVLPSSFFLASLREPGEGERREFVRAHVPMQGRMRTGLEAQWIDADDIEDLSAAGFCVPCNLPFEIGERVHIELIPKELSAIDHDGTSSIGLPINGVARVVRVGEDTAFEFVELGSSEENRVSDLVFGAREAALLARLRSVIRAD